MIPIPLLKITMAATAILMLAHCAKPIHRGEDDAQSGEQTFQSSVASFQYPGEIQWTTFDQGGLIAEGAGVESNIRFIISVYPSATGESAELKSLLDSRLARPLGDESAEPPVMAETQRTILGAPRSGSQYDYGNVVTESYAFSAGGHLISIVAQYGKSQRKLATSYLDMITDSFTLAPAGSTP